jgi:threonylcarbamoyladenosine tRNA methylthiotransferase MtaB
MEKRDTFAIYTLGCKLNFSESSEISRQLQEFGLKQSNSPDYLLVNSCAVTAVAEKKVRNLVSKLSRQHPESKIIILGCYSELSAEEVAKWKNVSAVFGSANKIDVVPYLVNGAESKTTSSSFFPAYSSHDRTRSFLKIQDGCDYHCSYCTVATARGISRSDTVKHVLKQLEEIHNQGIKEVILTGVNLGDFGRKNGSSLFELLQEIEKLSLIERIRISSIEPNLLTDEIIDLTAHSKIIMPHFHIPLQSGSDKILSLMKRRYNSTFFANKIHQIKKVIPHACLAVDIITGFPDEQEKDFMDSYNFVNNLPISYLHVFTYSKRPNTPAASMENHIAPSVKKERTKKLLLLSKEKKESFYKEHLGEKRSVLIESDHKKGCLYGFTDNYIKIKLPYEERFINKILPIELTEGNVVLNDFSTQDYE